MIHTLNPSQEKMERWPNQAPDRGPGEKTRRPVASGRGRWRVRVRVLADFRGMANFSLENRHGWNRFHPPPRSDLSDCVPATG